MEHHMNRARMMIEDAAFSALELVTIVLCLHTVWTFWEITP
jgi:hypothetical protein